MPELYELSFTLTTNAPSDAIAMKITGGDSPSAAFPQSIIATLGDHKAIDTQTDSNFSLSLVAPTPSVMRHLIELEVSAMPGEVGPPIAIVMIDKDGAHWISQGVCKPKYQKK